jgi:hypothetical protein
VKLHPALAALQADDAPQRRAQAHLAQAFDRWRAAAGDVLADLPRLAARGCLADAPALAALFTPGAGAAGALVSTLVTAMGDALAQAPLGHVPARHATDGVTSTLLLGRHGPVTLALAAVDGAGWGDRPVSATQPPHLSLSPARCWDVVVAGRGRAHLLSLDGVRDVALAPGVVCARDGQRQALHLAHVEGCLVWLRLQWRDVAGGAVRVHDRASGALVAQNAGTMRESRQRVMLGLLGCLGYRAAAPLMARMACEGGTADLRWAALKEALGLDTALGFGALVRLAQDMGDPLQPHAAALRDQLLARHPALEGLLSCPA